MTSEFEWDDNNLWKIAHRGILPKEVEEAFADYGRYAVAIPLTNGELRDMVIGRTVSGMLLTIICTYRNNKIRMVTARRAHRREHRWYEAGGPE